MRLLLAALLFSATASAATTQENVAKYQALRSRLNTEFIVVGDAAGMSQPADERIEPEGIIDFSVGPIPNPGYTAGWVGWGTLNAADTLSSPYQIWGVPKTDFYDTPYATWPRIRGSTAARYPSSVSTYVTSTPGDVSAGNSGTGLIQYVDVWGGWYVTGTVRDYQNNSCCARARRLESSYLAYIQSSSTEY